MYIVINKIYSRRPRGPKSAGPVAIATFSTIFNPTLAKSPTLLCPILVWSQQNYLKLLLTARYFESS